MADWLRLKLGRQPRPLDGQSALYVDNDGVLTLRDEDGNDTEVGGGGNGGSQPGAVVVKQALFTETTGAGTYTAEVEIPAGGYVIGITCKTLAAWAADSAVMYRIGDSDDPDAWVAVGIDNDIQPLGQGWTAADIRGNSRSWISADELGFYPDGTTISIVCVTTGAGGSTGRTRFAVIYSANDPLTTNAVKS